MSTFTIYQKSSTESVRATAKKLKYVGSFGKVAYVEFAEIASPTTIAWEVGDHITYRGIQFQLYGLPQPEKQATANIYGGAFLYKNVQLFAPTKALEITPFRDRVLDDNNIHFTSLPDVSTYENVQGIADRIQANLNDFYPNEWQIKVVATADTDLSALLDTPMAFSLSDGTLLGALDLIYTTWKLNGLGIGWIYTYEDNKHTITIGRASVRDNDNTTSVFKYGKGQGLKLIKKAVSGVNDIATRLFVYGSNENMPARYYNKITPAIKDNDSVYIPNLMIPLAHWLTTDGLKDAGKAYIDASKADIDKWGVRTKVLRFDGSGDYEKIMPSIENATIKNVRDGKTALGETDFYPKTSVYPADTADVNRIDEIKECTCPDDSGVEAVDGKAYEEQIEVEQSSVGFTNYQMGRGERWYDVIDNVFLGTLTKTGPLTLSINNSIIDLRWQGDYFALQYIKCELYVGEKNYGEVGLSERRLANQRYEYYLKEVDKTITEVGDVKLKISFFIYCDPITNQEDEDIGPNVEINVPAQVVTWRIKYYIKSNEFTVTLKQIGFDIISQATNDVRKISMKDGQCGGREFDIIKSVYQMATDDWLLTCKRYYDDSLKQWFPNNIFGINKRKDTDNNTIPDRFVLLNIEMPKLYVEFQSARMYDLAVSMLPQFTKQLNIYTPEIDSAQMQRWSDASSPRDLWEGMYFQIYDEDVVDDTTDYVLIDSVSIEEGADALPKYSVTLRDEKRLSKSEKTKSAINKLQKDVQNSSKIRYLEKDIYDSATKADGGASPSGTYDHFKLYNLDIENQHPISAITDLQIKIDTYDSMFERFNSGTEEAPIYTIRALKDIEIIQSGNTYRNISNILRHLFVENIGTTTSPVYALRSDIGFYSDSFVSAGGLGSGGGGGSDYSRLDAWSDYDSSKSGWVLSALLGNNLNTRVAELEHATISLNLNGLTDVTISAPTDGQVLSYNGGKWVNKSFTAVMTMKGVVATGANLPTSGNSVGDVYHINADGSEVVWLVNEDVVGWEPLGGTVDLSGYLPLSGGTMTGTLNAQDVIPTEGTYKLGSATKRWDTLFTSKIDHNAIIGVYNGTVAQGMYMGSLGVASNYNALTVPANGIYSQGDIVTLGTIKIGDAVISWDSINNALKVNKSFYSDSFVSAGGLGSGGGGGSDYSRLDAWSDYDSSKSGWVLSALLGNNLNERVTAIEAGGAVPENVVKYGNTATYGQVKTIDVVATAGAVNDTLYIVTTDDAQQDVLITTIWTWNDFASGVLQQEDQTQVVGAYSFKQIYDKLKGGAANKVLKKNSDNAFDFGWGDAGGFVTWGVQQGTSYRPLTITSNGVPDTSNISLTGHKHAYGEISNLDARVVTLGASVGFTAYNSNRLGGNAASSYALKTDLSGYSLTTHNHDTVYLGINAQAKDSAMLGGAAASSYVTLTGSQGLTNKTYNGYTLAAACAKGVTTSVTNGSTDLITSGGVYNKCAEYLPLTSQAADSAKLGGVAANRFWYDGNSGTTSYDWACKSLNVNTSYGISSTGVGTFSKITIGGYTIDVYSGKIRINGSLMATGQITAGA